MRGKPNGCNGCPLQRAGLGFSEPDGKGKTTGVLVVAEALGGNEAAAGVPLVGPAGKTWDRIVSRTVCPDLGRNLQRDDFLMDNCVRCQPPNNILVGAPYELAALDQCRPNLEGTIRAFRPRAILALGNTALRWFTGQWGIEQLRGYVFDSPYGPVIPTYHPSYIMRGKWNLARVVQMDVLKAIRVAREGAACLHVDKAYELQPSYTEAAKFFVEWGAAGRPPLAFDIETPRADEASENEDMTFSDDPSYTILMISFSYAPFKAISFPWQQPYISLAADAFAQPADFVVWNAAFDVPRLMHNGIHFGGRIIDAMLAWHWLEPALPMGLKYVATFFCPDMGAWKLGMHQNFQWYNCADSDVLSRVFSEIRTRLVAQGRWAIFERHFLDYGKILTRMSERGVEVDHEARTKAREHFTERFNGVVAASQQLAPRSVLSVQPKRGYSRDPKDTTGMVRVEVELTEQELARKRKEAERGREKARKEREKRERAEARARAKAERDAAKQAAKAAREARRAERQAAKLNVEAGKRNRRPRHGDAGGTE